MDELVLLGVEVIVFSGGSPIMLEEHALRFEIAIEPTFYGVDVLGNERVLPFLGFIGGRVSPAAAVVRFPIGFIAREGAQTDEAMTGALCIVLVGECHTAVDE